MNKQIYGITLFVVIVSFSVFIFEYLSYSDEPDCGQVMSARCISTIADYVPEEDPGLYFGDGVKVGIEYVEADIKSRSINARVNLEWHGKGAPPAAIRLQLQLHNLDGSSVGWTSGSFPVKNPFKNGAKNTVETSFDCERCASLPRNLYASADVMAEANVDKKLVYEIGKMKPVVVQE